MMATELQPRRLRPVDTPPGLFLRLGRNDHKAVLQMLAEGRTSMSGAVFDACLVDRHDDLRAEMRALHLEAVLDPRSVELATPGGLLRPALSELPWAGDLVPHSAKHLAGPAGRALADTLANFVVDRGFSAVLAPTHYLQGATDPWLAVDRELVRHLRRELDALGGHDIPIYYPLALPAKVLRDKRQRGTVVAALAGLEIDALWLRLHPFGTTSSGPIALRGYIEGCRALHVLGVPLIGEHTGTVGLPLLAFGAVGGIENGVTYGERYDVSGLLRPPANQNPFSPPPRVYIKQLGTFLSRAQAQAFFAQPRMKSAFACRDTSCCRRGIVDMDADPRRHFLIQRLSEVRQLGDAPVSLRAGIYLDDFLRPATDLALLAARAEPTLEPTRLRLESWRNTLGALQRTQGAISYSIAPEGHRNRTRRTGLGA